MLALRQIRLNDYYVVEYGEIIGRIRYSSERTPREALATLDRRRP